MDGVRQRYKGKKQTYDDDDDVSPAEASKPARKSFSQAMLITTIIVVLTITFGYFNSSISAVPIEGIVTVPLTGSFAVNKRLSEGKQIPMRAPESIVEDNQGNLYTGLRDGRLVKIHPSAERIIGEGELEYLTNGKLPTSDVTDSLHHGIPLGIRLRGDVLYVMDAIYGLLTINTINGETNVLLKPSDVTPPLKFPNDLDITADGSVIYFTDSSLNHSIVRLADEFLEGTCTGRLFSLDLIMGKIETLVTGLCFANGVQLTKDEKMLIVTETTRYRVLWIDVKSRKTRHVLYLPAMPDNVRMNRHGSHWIAASGRSASFLQVVYDFPFLRQIASGLLPQNFLASLLNRKHNMLFEVNDHGELFSTRHDPDGTLTFALAQGTELSDGRTALCSYAAPFLAISTKPGKRT